MSERISTAEDFPNLAVYRENGAKGPVYSIVFGNLEYPEEWRSALVGFGLAALLASFFAGVKFLLEPLGMAWAPVWLVAVVCYCVYFKQPWKTKRTIALDMGNDRLHVLKNGRPEAERQLSRMANLTVEDHPDAELHRVNRQQKGEKRPSREEEQHCLKGWFGARGAEQVILLYRAEWPSRHSLLEVREAILWTIEQAAGARSTAAPDVPRAAAPSGINPPLD